jgi:hypothetical protein
MGPQEAEAKEGGGVTYRPRQKNSHKKFCNPHSTLFKLKVVPLIYGRL